MTRELTKQMGMGQSTHDEHMDSFERQEHASRHIGSLVKTLIALARCRQVLRTLGFPPRYVAGSGEGQVERVRTRRAESRANDKTPTPSSLEKLGVRARKNDNPTLRRRPQQENEPTSTVQHGKIPGNKG